jgi:hypothetical protein
LNAALQKILNELNGDRPLTRISNDIREINDVLTAEAKRLHVALPAEGLPNQSTLSNAIVHLERK